MPSEDEPAKRITDRHIQTVCLMILAGVAGVYVVYWLRPVLVPFIVACFIVSGVGPILSYLENRFHVSRVVAAGMAFLFGVGLMGIFGLTISFSIIDLAKNKEDYRKRVRQLVDKVDDQFSFDVLSFGKSSPENVAAESETEELKTQVADREVFPPAISEDAKDSITDDSEKVTDNTDGKETTEQSSEPNDSTSPETAGPTEFVDDQGSDDEGEVTDSRFDEAEYRQPVAIQPVQIRQRSQPVESERMQEATELVDAFVRDGISVVLQAFLSLVSTSIVVLIYVFFLLLGTPKYAQTGTMREIDTQIRGYLSLKTVISIGTGAVFGLTLRLFGVPMALSFGVLAFLLNFIPNIGPIVASLLPIPLILLDPSGNIWWMVSVILATSTIQLISGNVVEPKLMGNSSDLHPVSILLGLMFWGMMWGIIGMFLATPITAAMKIVLERFEPTRQIANIMAGRWESSTGNESLQ